MRPMISSDQRTASYHAMNTACAENPAEARSARSPRFWWRTVSTILAGREVLVDRGYFEEVDAQLR